MTSSALRVEAASVPRLFVDLEPVSGVASSPASIAEYRIDDVRLDLLTTASGLVIPLPGGELEAERTALRESPRSLTWSGRLAEPASGSVVFTASQGVLSGIVFTADAVYQIVPQAEGGHHLVLLDQDLFPPCSGGIVPDAIDWPAQPGVAGGVGTPASRSRPATGDAEILDVLIVYTPQARLAAGGPAQLEATIANAVAVANTSYGNSDVAVELHLVHTAEVAYTDSGNLSTDLTWAASSPEVAALRDAAGADMVSLMVGSGGCGIGYVQRNPGPFFAALAFQVTVVGCAVGNLSLAHEFGHLQGAEHNPENASLWPDGGSFPWSYGHWNSGSFRTVMSYSDPCGTGCTRQPYYSNAEVFFAGLPTGLADARENYRTLNATAAIVADFRQALPIFADSFSTGNTSGWSAAVGN